MLRITSVLKACLRSNCAKTFCSALRTLGFAAAAFGAGSFAVSGDARAMPVTACPQAVDHLSNFCGLGSAGFGIFILNGNVVESGTSQDSVTFFDPSSGDTLVVTEPFALPSQTAGGTVLAAGVADGSFTQVGAFAAAGFVLAPPVNEGGVAVFLPFQDDTVLTLTANREASVVFDLIFAVTPLDELDLTPTWTEGRYFDPSTLFDPSQILFSCTASNLNRDGCQDLADPINDPFWLSTSFNDLSALVAVATVQGMTAGDLPDRALPMPAHPVPVPPALALMGLGLLGLRSICRTRSAH